MTLTKYKSKRNLKKSGEPKAIKKESKTTISHEHNSKGKVMRRKPIRCPRFVIHKHHASHLHWDLRLEMNNVLKSWAVPKEPPKTKGVKRLAIAVEDHPLDYATFEGTIPKGNYGAGKVEIWDNGTFELIEKDKNKIEFKLNGKKMKGTFVLIKTNYGSKPGKSWLFMKL